jgi:hypothetical protein
MYLNAEERDRRFEELRKRMKANSIDALLIVGMDTRGGGTGTGSFRYLTDFFCYLSLWRLSFFQGPGSDPFHWLRAPKILGN